ncbi:hypothetical protein BGW42_003900 [Actinomortierella wolfii]|nr:hypothetical protein BGW42_003900 [Actinomortierella wolfii]
MDEDEPSTWSMILSTIITIVTLVGLWYCFRRASTLFPRAISIPLDNFMQGQRSRRRGPIALDDDDWRDAEVLEEGLFVEDNVDDNEHDDDDEDYDHVNDHHNNNNHRYRSYNHETGTRDDGGSRPLLPVTTADTQRFSLEIEGEEDEDDEEVEQDRRVLGRKEEDVSTTMVYDIGGDDEDNSDDEDDENTAIRTPYKDDDDEDVKK